MRATFTTLFDRSRYSSGGRRFGLEDDAARKRRMEQQERFAVGMIGHALEHDAEFRRHFFERVCGLPELSLAHDWDVLIEPHNWGDLVLKHRASNSLLVAEFKIGAELAEHQNPSSPRFNSPSRNGECAGYGWEIAQIASQEHWAHLKYVTVEKEAPWSRGRTDIGNLVCIPLEWSQFLRADVSQESKLEADVYDCLGSFGVGCFLSRGLENMKTAKHTVDGLNLLIAVAENFGWDTTNHGGDTKKQRFKFGHDYLGVELMACDSELLKNLSEKEQGPLLWFGYEKRGNDAYLSVWIYAAKDVTSIKEKMAKLGLAKSFQKIEPSKEGSNIGYLCLADDSPGDKEWFQSVLSKLLSKSEINFQQGEI